MDITNLDQIVMASLPFSITDGVNTLNDAIVGTQEYINNLTSEEILAIQQQRFTNFLAIISVNQPTVND